jgi:Bacterial archaeo-eukaryotic release factor family 3
MDTKLTFSDELELIESVKYTPAVSIVLPFEPKMSSKSEMEGNLRKAMTKVERDLLANYPAEKALPIIHRLQELIHHLNFNTHKKSIAIFVSPVVEKVFYLDMPMEEKIVIDESFEIRDLVYCKKLSVQYLVLLLSANSSRMYLGNCTKFFLIKSNIPSDVQAYQRDLPQRVTHYSDPLEEKEVLLNKFLHHMDDGLSIVLKAYPLPVFVLGAERVLGHFNKLTKNWKSIVGFIHGNYEEATETEIRELMSPYVADWQQIKQLDIIHQVEKAVSENKLASGIKEVWAAAEHKNCRLLVLERDYMFPTSDLTNIGQLHTGTFGAVKPFYIKDAVDHILERVLEYGGDVEFVDRDKLKDFGRIVLLKFY